MTRVLIIEDNLTLLDGIAFELEMRGYTPMQAMDGQEALQMLETERPDIIVSDIAMPNMDGYQLLENVRKNENIRDLPIIFLTAFDSKNAMRLAKELGVDDYLVKPFQPEDLVLAIENKLKRHTEIRSGAERQLDDTRRELLRLISHELRTPLTSVYAGSEMLAEMLQALPEDTPHELLGIIQIGARRMNRLVNQVLFLMQIDSGHLRSLLEKERTSHDISTLVVTAQEQVRMDHARQLEQVNIEVILPDDPLYVAGQSDFLVMMVTEILSNALTFSPDGGQVRLVVARVGSNAQVVIHDEGAGVPPDSIDKVWQRFSQVNRDQYEQQGAGLGLALVRESARLHGGDCTMTCDASGTTVTLTLPCSPEH